MKKCHKTRLEQLLRVIQEVPSNQLSLSSYYGSNDGPYKTRCVIGWAGQDEWFKKQGFHSEKRGSEIYYKNNRPIEATCDFFGLSWDDAVKLTLNDDTNISKTKNNVIKQIKSLLRRKDA